MKKESLTKNQDKGKQLLITMYNEGMNEWIMKNNPYSSQ